MNSRQTYVDPVPAGLDELAHDNQKTTTLRITLNEILEHDQKYRLLYDSVFRATNKLPEYLWDSINKYDAENLPQVLDILHVYGWPPVSIIGNNGEQGLFMVIQHAPLRLQIWALPLLVKAVARNNAPKPQLALLSDRIMTKILSRQLFGTQYYFTGNRQQLFPLLFPNKINQLRKVMGLEETE